MIIVVNLSFAFTCTTECALYATSRVLCAREVAAAGVAVAAVAAMEVEPAGPRTRAESARESTVRDIGNPFLNLVIW
jgi:hypothetical protein